MKANKALPISFATLAILLALICGTHQNANWTDWNIKALSDPNYGADNVLDPPSDTVRITPILTDHTTQYAYKLTSGINTCKLYCGPRSFLVINSSLIFCSRDTSTNFWSNLPIAVGISKPQCMPNVEDDQGCKNMFNVTNPPLKNLKVGQCNSSSWTAYNNANAALDCCYTNSDNTPSYQAYITPETNFTSRLVLMTLRNQEN